MSVFNTDLSPKRHSLFGDRNDNPSWPGGGGGGGEEGEVEGRGAGGGGLEGGTLHCRLRNSCFLLLEWAGE